MQNMVKDSFHIKMQKDLVVQQQNQRVKYHQDRCLLHFSYSLDLVICDSLNFTLSKNYFYYEGFAFIDHQLNGIYCCGYEGFRNLIGGPHNDHQIRHPQSNSSRYLMHLQPSFPFFLLWFFIDGKTYYFNELIVAWSPLLSRA